MCPSVYAAQLVPSISSAPTFLNQQLSPQPDFYSFVSTDCLQIAITDFTVFCVFSPLALNENERVSRVRLSKSFPEQPSEHHTVFPYGG